MNAQLKTDSEIRIEAENNFEQNLSALLNIFDDVCWGHNIYLIPRFRNDGVKNLSADDIRDTADFWKGEDCEIYLDSIQIFIKNKIGGDDILVCELNLQTADDFLQGIGYYYEFDSNFATLDSSNPAGYDIGDTVRDLLTLPAIYEIANTKAIRTYGWESIYRIIKRKDEDDLFWMNL